MKKILYLFGTSLLMLTSCTSDDKSSTDPATATLVMKDVYVDPSGQTSTRKITYKGNKIVKTVVGTYETVYTYTGDLITKKEEFSNGNNISRTTEYNYENHKLKMGLTTEYSGGKTHKSKEIYIHNSDGTVDYEYYDINTTTGVEALYNSCKYTFLNGNVVKEDGGTSFLIIFEYDTKNSPTKNILGLNKFIDSRFSVNNEIKRTDNSNGSNPSISTSQYDYNADGFPTEQRNYGNDGKLNYTMQYSY
jgi:hypothetical protein